MDDQTTKNDKEKEIGEYSDLNHEFIHEKKEQPNKLKDMVAMCSQFWKSKTQPNDQKGLPPEKLPLYLRLREAKTVESKH